MTDKMKFFLLAEFGLETLNGLTGEQIKLLYEKCYDIEVEEELKKNNSERGTVATALVDYLYNNFANVQ